MNKLWVRWLLLVLALSPAIVPLNMILDYGVNTPYWDEWDRDFAGMYVKAHHGQLTFADLAAAHNEHRHLLPRIMYLGLNSLTHWDVIIEMIVQWLVAGATSIGILWLYQMNSRDSQRLSGDSPAFLRFDAIFLWFLTNLLIFSHTQLETWLWGIALANLMPMFFMVAALLAARSKLGIWVRTVLAILLCSAATYSAANGALSWGLVGAVLLWSQSWSELKSRIWNLAALVGALVINLVLYFSGSSGPAQGAENSQAAGIGAMARYVLLYTGSMYRFCTGFALAGNAAVAGIILLLLLGGCAAYFFYVWRWRGDIELCRRMLVWFALAGYAFLSGVISARSRAGIGPSAPFAMRYIAYSLYLPLALVFLVPLIIADLRRLRALPMVLATILVMGWLLGMPSSFAEATMQAIDRRAGKAILLLMNVVQDDRLMSKLVFPTPEIVRQLAPELNKMGYLHPPLIETSNAAALKPADAGPNAVAGTVERSWKADDIISMTGWATFPALHRPADALLLCYNNARGEPIIMGLVQVGAPRQDRAEALNDEAFRFCGWNADVSIAALPPEPRSIILTLWALDTETGKAYPIEGSATINR